MTAKKIALLAALVGAVTALHYLTTIDQLPLHILYRELYLIPIILAGLWGGRKWGLATSLQVSLLFLPHILSWPARIKRWPMWTGTRLRPRPTSGISWS